MDLKQGLTYAGTRPPQAIDRDVRHAVPGIHQPDLCYGKENLANNAGAIAVYVSKSVETEANGS